MCLFVDCTWITKKAINRIRAIFINLDGHAMNENAFVEFNIFFPLK